MKRPIITLLTDFGQSDYYVGAMKGVILSICPEAHLVDITHEIAPYQIRQAAWMLDQVWRCFPPGTVHLAVVDPGVGSERKAILAEAAGHFWVAPDNGLLTSVLSQTGAATVREITASQYFRHPVSRTFHGRDVFAPVAAHLSSGVPPDAFGPLLSVPQCLPDMQPVQIAEAEWEGEVLSTDHFGNIVTSFDAATFGWVADVPFELLLGGEPILQYDHYYQSMHGGRLYLMTGSSGYLEVAAYQSHAASLAGVSPGCRVRLRRCGERSQTVKTSTGT